MDRFYNEDSENEKPFFGSRDDDDDDDDDDLYDMEQDAIAYIQGQDLVDVIQAGIAQDSLKHNLLDKAIKIAESHWLWRFKSSSSKTKEISVIYETLIVITDEPPPPEPKETVIK